MTVYTLGSINLDHVMWVPHLPRPGETLAATGYLTGLGGKGANQSVAAVRAGAQVRHIGAVGPDGAAVRDRLAAFGVDVTHVTRSEAPTGQAMITVEPGGENSIVVVAGANRALVAAQVEAALSEAQAGDTLLVQNETSQQAVAAAAARARGMRVVYSAAPFEMAAVTAVLPLISVLLMNEGEAGALVAATGQALAALPVDHVVVTRGAAGAVHHDLSAGTETAYPSLPATPVDTSGAGDTFAGFLAAQLDSGTAWAAGLPVALAAAALSTTRPGAAEAIPELAAVRRAMA